VLVRHGETEWTRTGRHTGRTDIPLNENGQEEARRLCAGLLGVVFARVLSSPLSRAWETCQLAGLGPRAQPVDDLVEWDYGEYEGRRTADIRRERPGWSLWRDGVPGGESAADVGARADRVLAELSAVDGDVALFGHGHVLRVLTARWLGLPPADGRLFALDPASLSILGHERETAVIERWNDPSGHLEPHR
jgi:probable phosphoglycerate mutase